MKKGFTLIELLVVVLIIGILSAMALPQYNKAVEKARATEAQMMIRDITLAIDRYIMQNGYPTSDQAASVLKQSFDIEPATSTTFAWDGTGTKCTSSQCSVEVTETKGGHFKLGATKAKTATAWTRTCYPKSGDDVGTAVCKSMNGYTEGTAF